MNHAIFATTTGALARLALTDLQPPPADAPDAPAEPAAPSRGPVDWAQLPLAHPGLRPAPKSPAAGRAGSGEAGAGDRVKDLFKQQFGAKAADRDGFHAFMKQVYGNQYDRGLAEQYRQRALAGDYGWLPEVKLVGRDALGGAHGAYDAQAGVVYIDRELAARDPQLAAQTFVEEAGHHLDAKLNRSDTQGDEGEIFRRLLGGERLSAQQVAEIRNENDKGTITVDGRRIEVEFWNPVKWVSDGAKKVGGAIVDGAKTVGGAIVDGAKTVGDAIVGGAKTVGGWVADGAKALGEAGLKSAGFLGGVLGGAAVAIGGAAVEGAKKVGGAVVDGAKKVGGAVVDGARWVGGAVVDGAKAVGGAVVDGARWVGGAVVDGAKWVGRGVEQVGGGLIRGIGKVGEGAWGALKNFGQGVWEMTGGFATHLFRGDFREALDSIVRGADRAVFQSTQRFFSGVLGGAQSAADGFTDMLGPVGKPLRWVTDRAFDIGHTALDTAFGIGRDAFRMIPDTVTGFVGDVERSIELAADGRWGDAAEQFGLAFVNAPKRLAGTMVDMGSRLLQGSASAAQTAVGAEPPARGLNSAERAYLERIYGPSIDYDMVRIKRGGPLNDAMQPHTVGNTIYLPSSQFDANGNLTAEGLATLGHEAGHVWQNQNGGGDYIHNALASQATAGIASGDWGNAYDWRDAFRDGRSFEAMNEEQRARVMEDIGRALGDNRIDAADGMASDTAHGTNYGNFTPAEVAFLRATHEKLQHGEGAG